MTPQELESILLTHPSIAEAAVVPATKVNQQEVPIAFVVLKPRMTATAEQIKEFINGLLKFCLHAVFFSLSFLTMTLGTWIWIILRDACSTYEQHPKRRVMWQYKVFCQKNYFFCTLIRLDIERILFLARSSFSSFSSSCREY